MGFKDDINAERLLPTDKKYSVVKLDTFEPPSSMDAAVKLYEVDDLAEANAPDQLGIIWLAYDHDGNSYDLPVEEDDHG